MGNTHAKPENLLPHSGYVTLVRKTGTMKEKKSSEDVVRIK